MNKIENGGRRVTAFELSEIARVLNRRLEWFLTEPTQAIVSHREREGTSRRAIDALLETLTREVEFVASMGGKSHGEASGRPALAAQAESWRRCADLVLRRRSDRQPRTGPHQPPQRDEVGHEGGHLEAAEQGDAEPRA